MIRQDIQIGHRYEINGHPGYIVAVIEINEPVGDYGGIVVHNDIRPGVRFSVKPRDLRPLTKENKQ